MILNKRRTVRKYKPGERRKKISSTVNILHLVQSQKQQGCKECPHKKAINEGGHQEANGSTSSCPIDLWVTERTRTKQLLENIHMTSGPIFAHRYEGNSATKVEEDFMV